MSLRTVARIAGVFGGLCWVVRLVLDSAGAGEPMLDGPYLDGLYWAGLALLGASLVGAGANLVSRSAVWLRVIVGIAFPVLVWSVLEVLHDGFDAVTLDALAGAVLAVIAVVGLVRARGHRRHRGRSALHSH